tara:strand:+ start:745 stop:1233 length:489 start_codon:yes stop_codon:yes gene_type:complete
MVIEEVEVTEGILTLAKQKSKDMGSLNNSITKGEGNVAGFIGEFVVADLIGAKVSNTYDYDLVSNDGLKIDVKTKRTGFKPRDNYDCSVAAFNTKQKCDQYYFVRVKNDFSTAWVLGYYPKDLYFKEARFFRKGDYDPDNRFTFKADCYNMKIKELYSSGQA